MLLKEYKAPDTTGKNRTYASVLCDVCSSIFTRQVRQLKTHTCSRMCYNILTGTAVELDCAHCTEKFVRAKSKLSLSKSGLYFCSRECKDLAQSYMLEIQPGHYGTGSGAHTYREKAFKHYKPICSVCGFANIKALEVHHKDRNRQNNSIDNLEILCANCHTIEHLGALVYWVLFLACTEKKTDRNRYAPPNNCRLSGRRVSFMRVLAYDHQCQYGTIQGRYPCPLAPN